MPKTNDRHALTMEELAAAEALAAQNGGDGADKAQDPEIVQQPQAGQGAPQTTPVAPLIAIGPRKVEPVNTKHSRIIPLALDNPSIFVLRRPATAPGVLRSRTHSGQGQTMGVSRNEGRAFPVNIKGVQITIETLRSNQAGAAVDATYRRVHLHLIAPVQVRINDALVSNYPLFNTKTREALAPHLNKDASVDLSVCTFTVSMNASGSGAHVLRLTPGFNPLNKQGFCLFNLDVISDRGNIDTGVMRTSVVEATVKAIVEVGQYFDLVLDAEGVAQGVLNERGAEALDSSITPEDLKDIIAAFQQMPTEAAILSEAYAAVLAEYTERLNGYNPTGPSNNDLGNVPAMDLAQRLAAATGQGAPVTPPPSAQTPASEVPYIPVID